MFDDVDKKLSGWFGTCCTYVGYASGYGQRKRADPGFDEAVQ